MSKRIALAALAFLFALTATAQVTNRDVLLTSNGTLYSIESVRPETGMATSDYCVLTLVLTTQRGATSTRVNVPYALTSGAHLRPALAYDADSKTLFLFWTHAPNAMSSELLFCTLSSDGKWSELTTFEDRAYRLRYNLAIAVTRKVSTLQSDNTYAEQPGITAHAVWWEQTGLGEQARYAMLTIDNGSVSSIDTRDLQSFVASTDAPATDLDPSVDREVFRHPAIFDSSAHNSVDVIFGDATNNRFNRINIRPVTQGRLHVPTGHQNGGYSGPPSFAVAPEADRATLAIHSLWDRETNDLLFYYYANNAVYYLMNRAGTWSPMKSVAMTGGLNADAAPDVLRRMMAAE